MDGISRRQFLGGIGSVSLALLAGCGSPQPVNNGNNTDQGEDGNSSQGNGTDGGQSNNEAAKRIELAREQIAMAANKLSEESSKFEVLEGGVDFRTEAILEHLDTADKSLDSAKSRASPQQQRVIETLERISRFLRALTKSIDHMADAMTAVQTGFTHLQNNSYGDAIKSFEKSHDPLEEADSQLAVAENILNNIDTNQVSEIENINIDTLRKSLEELNTTIELIRILADSFTDISRGYQNYLQGLRSYDGEKYQEAAEYFRKARDNFASARSTFKEGEEIASSNTQSSLSNLTCLSGELRDSSDHYKTAAEAASKGDMQRAKSERKKAQEVLNRCDESA